MGAEGTFNPGGLNAPPKSIVNAFSSGGRSTTITNTVGAGPAKYTLSGALTAGVYKELITSTGPGILKICGIASMDATARTISLKVILDGATVFDAPTDAIAAANTGLYAVGFITFYTAGAPFLEPETGYVYNSSMGWWVKSSLSETDKVVMPHMFSTH